MTHLPRRRVEPLPPPPGSFDAVLGRARARRYRRLTAVSGVAGVFLAGIVGGLAMGGGAAVDNIVSLATRGQVASVSPSPTAPQTKQASGVPTTRSPHKTRPARSTPAASSPAPPPVVVDRPELVRGRAVTAGGDPVAGLYVYTGSLSGGGFVPAAEPSTLTGAQGRFAVPCGPVLLTSWPLNTRLDVTSGGRWEATVRARPALLARRGAAGDGHARRYDGPGTRHDRRGVRRHRVRPDALAQRPAAAPPSGSPACTRATSTGSPGCRQGRTSCATAACRSR